MKRIALYVTLVAMGFGTWGASLRAQTARPNFESLAKKLAKSDASIADAKKGQKVATWLDRGALLTEIAGAHTLNAQNGWDEATIMLVLGKPSSESQAEVNGTTYHVLHYGEVDLYMNENKQLTFTKVVQPVVVDPLSLAYDAYLRAASLDTKGKKSKKIGEGLRMVHDMLFNDGVNFYTQGEYGKSVESLELSIEVGRHELLKSVDTIAMYYAGLACYQKGDKEKAIEHFGEAIESGYTNNGELICTYYGVAKEAGKVEEGKAMLQANLSKYPGQKCLMLSLVDYYISQGKDPKEALPYLETLIANDPKNAQLYFVKGVVLQNMEDEAGALAAYQKSSEMAPDYVDPVYNIAVMYYNDGVALQKKAIDDSKLYDEYMKKAEEKFRKAIPAAEKALEVQPGYEGAVDILHTLYFKYRREPEMQKKLDALMAKYPKK